MKDVADKTVVDAGFQSENIVSQVVESLDNVLQTTDENNEDTRIKMANATIQSTQILTQLLQKMQKM